MYVNCFTLLLLRVRGVCFTLLLRRVGGVCFTLLLLRVRGVWGVYALHCCCEELGCMLYIAVAKS